MSYDTISNDWIEHCTGYIAVEVATKANSIDNGREAEEDARMWQDAPKTVSQTCLSPLDMVSLMSILDDVGGETLPAAMLPTFLREVWVSSTISSSAGHTFRGHSKSTPVAAQRDESDVMVSDGQVDEGGVAIKGLKSSPLSSTESAETRTTKFCHTIEWKPDVDLLKSDMTPNVTLSTQEDVKYRRHEVQDLQLATMLMIMNALDELKDVPSDSYEGHFQNYYQWLPQQARILKSDSMSHLPLARWMQCKKDKNFKGLFYRKVAAMGPEGALCVRMGSNIARVLKKEVDPLYLMFGMNDLLDRLYAELIDTGDIYNLTGAYLDLIGHSRTDLNVLEIGAGTGSSTAAFLEILSPLPAHEQSSGKSSRIAKYTFTDTSAGFFEKAKERPRICQRRTGFHFHAGRLRYAGGLVVGRGTIRKWGPWINEEQWGNVLRNTGFSGVEISLKDSADPDLHAISVLVASAVGDEEYQSKVSAETLIVTRDQDLDGLASALIDSLAEEYGLQNCSIVKYTDLSNRDLKSTLCVSLVELERSALADPTEEERPAIIFDHQYVKATADKDNGEYLLQDGIETNSPDGPSGIKAVGLNFRDIMIAMGQHNAVTLGSNGAGIVTRAGSAVKKVRVGDHVVYVDGMGRTGTFQTYGRVIEDVVAIIPKDTSFEVAASLPTINVTAIYGLYNLARLSKGETVLIYSAAGGVGRASIMLANLVGAEVFATASTPEKANLIRTKYGVKKDHTFSSRDLSFAKGVMRMTNSCGVDVILNSLAEPFSSKCYHGECRVADHDAVPTQTAVGLIEETIRLYTEGKIKEPSPTIVLSYSQLEESFRMLQSGKGMEKIVLVPIDDAIVPVVPQPPVPFKFEEKASYVLAGGIGGIGRSIAQWMASRGAMNIIFLSRSGAASSAAQETIQELESRGATVPVFACDVSDKARLVDVLKECKASLPSIKGCIQGSMVLADKIFENMSYEKFWAATRPKVQGSWNLHACLPRDMDFFILLSSVTGLVGNRGQANYTAGNTYQDALAAHRVSLGFPAISLDLGTLLSIGYVAENCQRLGHVTHVASLLGSVREGEIHSMIKYCLEPTGPSSRRPIQIASALTTAAQYRARGMPAPSWMHMPLFTQLASTISATTTGPGAEDSDSGLNITSLLGSATSLDDAAATVADAIRTKLSKLVNISIESINPSKSVSSNGVDSLVAVEFRTWLAKVVAADVPLLTSWAPCQSRS
ncbi:hypothetical protein VTN00DRAFT_9719 [Thermoascus crustaceus]|uniref:uncharacterized protein n=1 Tax=Thermoascus crustaceus TaxID=5088 RepID=UPI0037420A2C